MCGVVNQYYFTSEGKGKGTINNQVGYGEEFPHDCDRGNNRDSTFQSSFCDACNDKCQAL